MIYKFTEETGHEFYVNAPEVATAMKEAVEEAGHENLKYEMATPEEIMESQFFNDSEFQDVSDIFETIKDFEQESDCGNKTKIDGNWYCKIRIEEVDGEQAKTMVRAKNGWEEV